MLNPHLHVLALDGVFVVESDGFVRFHETRPPSDAAVARLNERIARAVRKILLADASLDEILTCDACRGPRKIVAFITQPSVIRKILEHCGLPADEVVLARSPPGCEEEIFA